MKVETHEPASLRLRGGYVVVAEQIATRFFTLPSLHSSSAASWLNIWDKNEI